MAEDIVQWPYDADPMANNEVSEGTRIMAANENDEDKMASVTVKQLADKAAERVEYTGIERPEPFDGGGTEGGALMVPDGPSGANQVADVVSGKWYDFGAGPVQASSSNRWRAYWDGSSWSLVDMGELPVSDAKTKPWVPGEYEKDIAVTHLPENTLYRSNKITSEEPSYSSEDWDVIGGVEKTNSVTEESNKVTTEKAVIDYSLPIFSDKALPYNYSFIEIDRADQPEKKLPVIHNEVGQIIKDDNKSFYLLDDLDRPDLAGYNVYVDRNRRLIKMEKIRAGGSGDSIGTSATDVYYNPSTQEDYSIGSSGTEWVDAHVYHERWEPFLNDDKYVSRHLLGESTEDGLPIYQYDFKPDNPTRKVVLFGGTHGSEKMAPVILYRFFRNLIENYSSAPALQWFRKNVHVVVVPLLSPDSYERRTRRVKETAPFNASWTKSGDVVTISFEAADFPTTNPNVSANDYFSNPGILGKTMLSVFDSNDQTGLPDNGYVIQSAPNGRTVTINVPSGGSASGTCQIYVSADPNRSFDLPHNPWEDFTPTGGMTPYQETVPVRNDNKGTRPYSLNESAFAKQVMDNNSDATFLIDFHNGAGDYDFRWNVNVDFDRHGADVINDLHRLYSSMFDVGATNNNVLSGYASQVLNMNGTTVEWGQHNPITEKIATDSQRWFGNLILIGSWYYTNKLQ